MQAQNSTIADILNSLTNPNNSKFQTKTKFFQKTKACQNIF